ncbi:MAG: glycosyltransferase [Nanoarchaeota archaeon]|nr:glycosyltransferase [Nanoarchaeota archaeon]
MITAIITAFKEPSTVGKAISTLGDQLPIKSELLVTAPDKETLSVARKLMKKYPGLKIVKDLGRGKSAALNKAISQAHGDILILTDGDVHVGPNAINNLMKPFSDKNVGAVSGNPVSINPKNEKYGFWAYLLTNIADKRRKKALMLKKRFFCSGYFFAIRKSLFPILPENLLSEDGYISHYIYEKGYKIGYSEKSQVYVKYPNNFRDWIKQKKRSAGGYNQLKKMLNVEIRSFRKESAGFFDFFKYASGFKEAIWLINLFLARIYLWAAIYRDVNLKKKTREELWERVESTK